MSGQSRDSRVQWAGTPWIKLFFSILFYFIFKYKIYKLKNRLQERNQNTTTLGEPTQAKGNSRNNAHMGSNLQRGQTSYKYVEGLDMDLCDHYPSLVGTCI